MNVRTYTAHTMAEALTRVRRELGKDAVILHTRTYKKGGLLGFGAKPVVEISASADVNVLSPAAKRRMISEHVKDDGADRDAGGRSSDAGTQDDKRIGRLHEDLELVKDMVRELVRKHRCDEHPAVPEELLATYLSLINQQVAEELAKDMIEQVKSQLPSDQVTDERAVREALVRCVERMVPAAGPIAPGRPGHPRVIAFVGPTGVGKTTTIAKLAANFRLRENKSVGLITIDTYRIAAVDQLKTYADIINVPLTVVLSPMELKDAVHDMRHCHVVLIDTAGRSQHDEIKLRELKSFFNLAKPDEIHLVLSSTASQVNVRACVDQFSSLGIDKIIFTKLDEAVGIGMLLNVVATFDRSISYITTGQSVPDDIEPGTGRRLARRLLEQTGDDNESKTTMNNVAVNYGA